MWHAAETAEEEGELNQSAEVKAIQLALGIKQIDVRLFIINIYYLDIR